MCIRDRHRAVRRPAGSGGHFASLSGHRAAGRGRFGGEQSEHQGSDGLPQSLLGGWAVSYTHLDVYKRQVPITLCSARLAVVDLLPRPSGVTDEPHNDEPPCALRDPSPASLVRGCVQSL